MARTSFNEMMMMSTLY